MGLMHDLKVLTEGLAAQYDGQAAVVIWPDDHNGPAGWLVTNAAGAKQIIARLLDAMLHTPRPDDCDFCGKAWDNMVEARLALTGASPPDYSR